MAKRVTITDPAAIAIIERERMKGEKQLAKPAARIIIRYDELSKNNNRNNQQPQAAA